VNTVTKAGDILDPVPGGKIIGHFENLQRTLCNEKWQCPQYRISTSLK
jgi:hypothetical protein